jgi:hypothetical protein
MHPRYLKMIYSAYFGGRCEALARGQWKTNRQKLFDFNSLFPSVMEENDYPCPNRFKYTNINDKYYRHYDGVTCCEVSSPADIQIPLLPWAVESSGARKVFFPQLVKKTGWWTNVELRKAEEVGYEIHKVKKSLYFTRNYPFFKGYISNLYAERMRRKAVKDPTQHCYKILLNSGTYGRFALRYFEKDKLIHSGYMARMSEEKEAKFRSEFCKEEPIEGTDMIRMKAKDWSNPPPDVIPIFSAYTTAYARIKLFDMLMKYGKHVLYMDTDSLITNADFPSSDTILGDMKLEFPIDYGIIVRPKFYGLRPMPGFIKDDPDYVKVKGLQLAISLMQLEGTIDLKKGDMKFLTQKFMRFKESLRQGRDVNEIISDFPKKFSIEDDKRIWPGKFDMSFQKSEPLKIR